MEKVGHKAKKTVSSLKINKEKDKALAPVSEWGFGGGGLGRVKNLDPGVESEEEEEEDDLLETVHHDLMIPHPRRDILNSRSVQFSSDRNILRRKMFPILKRKMSQAYRIEYRIEKTFIQIIK